MTIYPSILTDSRTTAAEQLEIAQDLSDIETVQLDIIDGLYADDITLTPSDFIDFDLGELKLDLHLMTTEPMDFVYECADVAGELPIRAIIGQIERMSSQQEFVAEVRKHNWKAGLSLDIYTPVEEIDDDVWQELDVIQLMSIVAGAQGQTFKSQVWEKIAQVQHQRLQLGRSLELVVDGGVKPENIAELQRAGVDSVTVGSHLWRASDAQVALSDLTGNLL